MNSIHTFVAQVDTFVAQVDTFVVAQVGYRPDLLGFFFYRVIRQIKYILFTELFIHVTINYAEQCSIINSIFIKIF